MEAMAIVGAFGAVLGGLLVGIWHGVALVGGDLGPTVSQGWGMILVCSLLSAFVAAIASIFDH
jgi:hypothetical protein